MNFFLQRVIPEETYARRTMKTAKSEELFARAQKLIPGGVNSPVRAFRGVGGTPPFIARGEGSRIFDVDGNSYIDYVGSWGPLILGHRLPPVIDALREVLAIGTSFGAPTEREVELAELIRECVPSMEMVRLVNSGTEATMSALRVARGFTGRDLTIKFEGCYHGHVDSLLVKAGSGMATLGIADTAGVPKAFAATTIALPFNSIAAVEKAFAEHGAKIAAVIVEPVVGNMGCVPPRARISGSSARAHGAARRAADLRRSDDRFPRGAGRRAAALRHPARSDHARQDHRRRTADGGLRRPRRHHEQGRARSARFIRPARCPAIRWR